MKEYKIFESRCKWWWFWLHPFDAMTLAHYGCICCDKDAFERMTKYGYRKAMEE